MFSREESQKIKQEFWITFGEDYPRKWTLYNTQIKGLAFKFYFDTKKAYVTLDLEDDLENRVNCWENLLSLKTILLTDYIKDAIFDEIFYLENGKEISRIWVQLEEKVSIHNKKSWETVMAFFNEKMGMFEIFFEEFNDIIKPSKN